MTEDEVRDEIFHAVMLAIDDASEDPIDGRVVIDPILLALAEYVFSLEEDCRRDAVGYCHGMFDQMVGLIALGLSDCDGAA